MKNIWKLTYNKLQMKIKQLKMKFQIKLCHQKKKNNFKNKKSGMN